MKPVLLTAAIAALVTVAACNREGGGNDSSSGNSAVPDAATGNRVEAPQGMVTAEQAYQIRHERYEEMGDSFKAINRELKGGSPDVARIQREAATLATLAEQIPSWFPVGSGPDVHTKSRAKAEIWSNPEGFRRAHAGYLDQAQSFNRTAQSGDVEAIRAAAEQLQRTCRNCHDDYRAPER